jgi:hypothetical protein
MPGAGPSNAMLADRLGQLESAASASAILLQQLESAVQRLQEALNSPPRGNPRQQRSGGSSMAGQPGSGSGQDVGPVNLRDDSAHATHNPSASRDVDMSSEGAES